MGEVDVKAITAAYGGVADYLQRGMADEMPVQPLYVYIEPVDACNLDCPFCATSGIERERQALNFDLYRKAIDEMVSLGWHRVIRLGLVGQGEALLHNRLADMVRLAKSRGVANVELITNATLLGRETAAALIDAGLDRIQFSIDSVRRETYDKLRRSKVRGRSYFNDAMRNILGFLRLNEERGGAVYTAISAVITSVNKDERDGFLGYWQGLPVDNIFFPHLSTLQNNCPSDEAERFTGDIRAKQVCVMPWLSVNVKSNGDVALCPQDYHNRYPVGNLRDGTLEAMWNGDRAKLLRRALLSADLGYFVGIGHDCVSCNNPCSGLGKDDFVRDLRTYMDKTVFAKMFKERSAAKVKNLDAAIAAFGPAGT